MSARDIRSFACVVSFLAAGCGARTAGLEQEIQPLPSGGAFASGGSVSTSGGTGVGGYAQGGHPSGGSPTTGGARALGGASTMPASGGGFASGGRSGGSSATGGNRFASGGGSPVTGGSSFASGGKSGFGGVGATTALGGSGGTSTAAGGQGGRTGASVGGTSAAIPSCVPGTSSGCVCADGSSGAQICQADGTYAACTCLLTQMRANIIGTWVGSRTTSWDGTHPVKVSFYSDGHYSAHCGDGCITMYWGVDDDSNTKTYSIDSVNSSAVGFGRIDIYFSATTTIPGQLSDITFDVTGTSLTFTVWQGSYGPLDFVLSR